MNIEIQCCGLAVLLLIWIFYFKQKTLGLFSKRLFLTIMGAETICLCLDILSIIAIVKGNNLPEWFLDLVCKTYIVSLIWVVFWGLLYANTDVERKEDLRFINSIYVSIVLVGTVLIYILPIYYFKQERVIYTYGPSCIATYIFALTFVLITLVKVTVYGRTMNRKRRKAVAIWMSVWLAAALVQFINPQLLLVGFASSLGMLILFFELENPEANLDRETGAFNAHALGEYMKQYLAQKKHFSAILVVLTDVVKENENDLQQLEIVLKRIIDHADKKKEIKVFKTVENEVMLIFEDEARMQEIFCSLQEWIVEQRDNLNARYVLLPDSTLLRSTEEFFYMIRLLQVEDRKNNDNIVFTLDEERINKFRERENVEEMIRAAIEEDRVEVFYQPIYSAKEKKFVSAEALVRIREKDGRIVPPGVFIPVAEATGLINRIGEIVFDKTCCFIKENQLRNHYGIRYVEVNLSVRQCEGRELADSYIRIMQKYDLDPSNINLEITESATISARNVLLENMQILIDYGVSFSLDDFGNGESNLNYIVDMPVSIVKFDRDMSQAYFASQKARFVMEASMRMIHDMELKIVSEGIETKEQMETIVNLGIDYIQGYYFSKPLPREQFLEFVSAKNIVKESF